MNYARRRSGGLLKKRTALNRSRLNTKLNRSNSVVQGENNCIKVVVRTRPLNDKEVGKGRTVVSVVDEHLLVFDPPEEDEGFFFQGQKQNIRDLNKRVNKNVRFLFDSVFDGSTSNEEVFSQSVQPIITSLLSGFNCSVFAYGATGAGKTFTMLGSPSEQGIIFHLVQNIYQKMEDMTTKTCELNISYLEVYNETVKDLLRASPPLVLRDDSKCVTVVGLSYQKPTCAEHLLQLLRFGNENRTQHPTDANAESSRSHAVFQIYLRIKDKVSGLSESVQLSKMSLIDLAGSERACVVSNHGRARQMEGANINRSLLALGSCINALATKTGKAQHIPYRNSKLTRILKDSLGGNCKTVMIAAISPSSLSFEDTYNTLRYAERAKRITVNLRRNATQVDAHLSGYKEIVTNLQTEIDSLKGEITCLKVENESLKRQLADSIESEAKRQKLNSADSEQHKTPEEDLLQSAVESLDSDWKDRVDMLSEQLLKLKKNILDSESVLLSIQARQFWRQFSHNRITALAADQNKITRSHNKLDTFMKSNLAKSERLTSEKVKNQEIYGQKMEILKSLLENENSELKRTYIMYHVAKIDTFSLHSHLSHVIELSTSNSKQTCEAWKVCEESLQHVRKLQTTLKAHGFLTSDLVSKYEDLLKQAECGREVAWADNPPVPNAFHQEFLNHLLLPSSGFVAPTPLCQPDIKMEPLTICSDTNQESASPAPSTPCKESVRTHGTPLASPSIASRVSPHYLKDGSNFRRGSPYPGNLKKLNTKELLALINKEEVPVRRSLEDTFNVFSQDDQRPQPMVDGRPGANKIDLQNTTFSPVGFSSVMANRPATLWISTPTTERIKSSQGSSFTIGQESCSALHPHNPAFLTEDDYHSHVQMNSVAGNECQQMHLPVQEYYRIEGLPQCAGCGPSAAVASFQRPACFYPPNVICPATVSRPDRLNTPRLAPQRVGSVQPNIRVPPSAEGSAKVAPQFLRTQGANDRGPHATANSGAGRAAQRQIMSKENLDPQRALQQRNVKRSNFGPQKPSVTPVMKNDRKLKRPTTSAALKK